MEHKDTPSVPQTRRPRIGVLPDGWCLRPADGDDLAAVQVLERLTFSARDAFSTRTLRAMLLHPRMGRFVVEGVPGEGLIGLALVTRRTTTAEIVSLAVHPAHRRRGVARLLLAELERWARAEGCFEIRLEVRLSNAAARRLYEQADYVSGRLLPGYYRDEDGLRYGKPLR